MLIRLIAIFAVLLVGRAQAEIDPGSPQGGLKVFYEALAANDVAALRGALDAQNEPEKQLADAFAAQISAAKALGEALKTKFNNGGDALTKGMPVRDELAKLESAQVKIDGESATVQLGENARPLRMVRSDGRWRVSIMDYAGATPQSVAVQAAVQKDMATAFNAIAADVMADKYATPQDAQRALQQKMQSVLFNTLKKHPPASTRSTTRPN